MGAEPIFDTVIDPTMEVPEHRVYMGRERVAEKVVFRFEPACGKVLRLARERHRQAAGRVARHRGPAHVQPIVKAQLHLRTELP
ncbi:hypothetical protein D3C80_1017040 [compost metagenome]